MALDDFFGSHDADAIQTLARAIERGEVGEERVDALRDRVEDTERTVLEDTLADQDFATQAAWNELEDALGLERTMPSETAPPSFGDVEVEERPEEQVEAMERAREIMFRGQNVFTDEQLRDTQRALENDNIAAAPVSVQGPLQRLDADQRQQLAEEIGDELDERVDELIGEAEPERRAETQFPGITAATDRGPGRGVPYFRGVLQELRGEADANRLPADELQQVRNQPTIRQQFIEKVEQNISQLQAQQQQQRGPPSIGRGQIDLSAEARRIVPGASRTDPTTGEQWTASPEQVELEQAFMEFVLQVKPNRNRWDDGFMLRQRPENRDISMEQWARLMVQGGNADVSQATRLGLPESWFQ